MTLSKFIRGFAAKNNISLANSDEVCRSVINYLAEVVNENDYICLTGFGTFRAKMRPPREVKHPATGEVIMIGERREILFKLSPKVTNAENDKEGVKDEE